MTDVELGRLPTEPVEPARPALMPVRIEIDMVVADADTAREIAMRLVGTLDGRVQAVRVVRR